MRIRLECVTVEELREALHSSGLYISEDVNGGTYIAHIPELIKQAPTQTPDLTIVRSTTRGETK